MSNNESQIAAKLLQIKAIKLKPQNPFTWASGIQSPIYCDNRKTLSHPAIRTFIKESLVEKSKLFGTFDIVAGVATAGIAHGALLADALNLPFAYIRSKAKGHGLQNRIEGDVSGSERVLVVEDLISTGGSSLEAVDVLKNVGCEVVGVLAIFTYGFEQSKTAFAAADCQLETLSNYDVLLEEALTTQYITADEVEVLKAWRKGF